MGIYSAFESLGQVLGPIVYGALLSLPAETSMSRVPL